MTFRILYKSAAGEFEKAMDSIYEPIAKAGTAAIRSMADQIKTKGRADIASAGFSKRWQNALRVDVFPKRGHSASAAAFIYHRIPYADVFEAGATIRGKPMLWIPLAGTPKKIGRKKMTAELYRKEIRPLFTINRPGEPPLLAAKISTNRRGQKNKVNPKVTLSALRRGAAASGPTAAVPLFVGIDSVKIRDRFSIRQITDRAASDLARLYVENLKLQGE